MAKILVIEDEAAVRSLIHRALRSQGHDVLVAEEGEAGVSIALRELPDLIICDIRMPKKDGFETLQALRGDDRTATTPFIFLTGYSERADLRQGMELGADDYLTKPFTLKELLASVATRLNKRAEVQKRSEEKLEELRTNISLALPHELLTPLNGVLGFADILAEDAATLTPAEVVEHARSIKTSAERLRRVIENFLLYSQIELIMAQPEKQTQIRGGCATRLKPLLIEVGQATASRHGRTGDLRVASEDIAVFIGADDLRKILEELVDNALKFSTAGTEVRLTGALRDRQVKVIIEDQGRGMTPEQVARMGAHMQFERRVYEQQGSGLGLTIARRLTELHGGQFSLESQPGAGTVVQLTLPTPEATATTGSA